MEDWEGKLKKTGSLLLLDAPKHLQFGIDNQEWTVGDKFKGLKLIPPGMHFVHFSMSMSGCILPKSGFFLHVTPGSVSVRKWSRETEYFEVIKAEEEKGYIEGVKNMDFDAYLGAYPMENHEGWAMTVGYITPWVLEKIEPLGKKLLSRQKEYEKETKVEKELEKIKRGAEGDGGCESERESDSDGDMGIPDIGEAEEEVKEEESKERAQDPKSTTTYTNMEDMGNDYSSKGRNTRAEEILVGESGTIFFTEIPKYSKLGVLKGPELTKLGMDKTTILLQLWEKEYEGVSKHMLGELQFAFVMFVLGENIHALDQWKKIIILICSSENAIYKYPEFYSHFIFVLYGQLKQLPNDFFTDTITKDNFLRQTLNNLYEFMEDPNTQKVVKQRGKKLFKMLKSQFNFGGNEEIIQQLKFGYSEQDEDMPMVVEQPEEFIKF